MGWLALDMGSTYTKCARLDVSGCSRERFMPAPPNVAKKSGRYELDAEAYYQQVITLLSELSEQGDQGILLSTQMHGCVLSDRAFKPVSPYISWQDQAGRHHFDTIRKELSEGAPRLSGVPLKPNLALCALMARRLDGESIPEDALFHTLGGYVISRLCGKQVCHITNAAPTGLADIAQNDWNEPLIQQAKLKSFLFPRIESGLAPVGTWQGIPIYPDLGDQQVCALGAALTPESDACVAIGTAGLIGILTAAWADGAFENRPWIIPGLYLRTVSGLPGGRHIRILHDFLVDITQMLAKTSVSEEAVWEFLNTPHPEYVTADNGDAWWELLEGGGTGFAQALYHKYASRYRTAMENMQLSIKQVVFTGGCAEKNVAFRACVEASLGAQTGSRVCSIMDGMKALARLLSGIGLQNKS
ncbi:hypothetical protein AGMMS49992_26460 [Clostridia bacterium]|nr:hypothetical protein AGMMS49992_26460 [Clostridia bacterium]